MSRSTSRIRVGVRHRVLVAVGVGLATVTVASGCAAGQIAQTAQIESSADGTMGTVGSISLRDVKLEFPQDGVYEQGQDARLTLVMVNGGQDDDALTSVRTSVANDVTFQTVSPEATETATPAPGETPGAEQASSIPLPAGQSVPAYADGARITLTGLTTSLRSGQTVDVTFTFREAGQVTLVVPVGVPLSPVPQPPPVDVSPTEH